MDSHIFMTEATILKKYKCNHYFIISRILKIKIFIIITSKIKNYKVCEIINGELYILSIYLNFIFLFIKFCFDAYTKSKSIYVGVLTDIKKLMTSVPSFLKLLCVLKF